MLLPQYKALLGRFLRYNALCYNHAMLVSDIGEFGLIEKISQLIKKATDKKMESWQNLVAGIGDDAAVWKSLQPLQVATTDILVEKIHFDLSHISWPNLGWKAMAVNLSDIAAMGAIPHYALVSLSLPGYHRVQNIMSMYRGMIKICNIYNTSIAGGNISSADNISINITLIGVCPYQPMTRATAKPGQLIAITGYPGLAAAGLIVLYKNKEIPTRYRNFLIRMLNQPKPLINEGVLLASAGVKTAIDISDGLIADLTHVCKASNLKAVIHTDLLPVHPILNNYFKQDYVKLILSGGEDYGLMFIAEKELIKKIKNQLKVRVTIIGETIEGKARGNRYVTVLDKKGKSLPAEIGGWDHYRQ